MWKSGKDVKRKKVAEKWSIKSFKVTIWLDLKIISALTALLLLDLYFAKFQFFFLKEKELFYNNSSWSSPKIKILEFNKKDFGNVRSAV